MNLEIISGSPRTESLTHRVALHLQHAFKASTINAQLLDVRTYNLPMVQNVWAKLEDVPAEYKELGKRMFAADAFILVTPEYNGGYSPAMKNLLDHFPKQHRKPMGIATASVGGMGGMRASQQMQHLICALGGIPCPTMLIVPNVTQKFNEKGELTDESYSNSIDRFKSEFTWLAQNLTK